MKIGDFYVEIVEDAGDNSGGYYCRIYDKQENYESCDGYIDEHCISKQDIDERGGLDNCLWDYIHALTIGYYIFNEFGGALSKDTVGDGV